MTGHELMQIRISLGYTQAALARAVGLTPNSIARYEMGSNCGRYPVPRWLALIVDLWAKERRGTP